ncbi:MAG TPA: hypothetical protein VIM40_00060 [Arthrobacter sp.]
MRTFHTLELVGMMSVSAPEAFPLDSAANTDVTGQRPARGIRTCGAMLLLFIGHRKVIPRKRQGNRTNPH